MRANVWTAGPFRGWPSSVGEEHTFIEQAYEDCDADTLYETPLTRGDLVTLTVSLREGADYQKLREFLPGVTPEGLVVAYEHLDSERVASLEAWNCITSNLTYTSVIRNAGSAARILPATVGRLLIHMQEGKEELGFVRSIQYFEDAMREDTRFALKIEKELQDPRYSDGKKLKLGEELFHPERECAWISPYYVPRRVTDLSPERVNAIMGEDIRTGVRKG